MKRSFSADDLKKTPNYSFKRNKRFKPNDELDNDFVFVTAEFLEMSLKENDTSDFFGKNFFSKSFLKHYIKTLDQKISNVPNFMIKLLKNLDTGKKNYDKTILNDFIKSDMYVSTNDWFYILNLFHNKISKDGISSKEMLEHLLNFLYVLIINVSFQEYFINNLNLN